MLHLRQPRRLGLFATSWEVDRCDACCLSSLVHFVLRPCICCALLCPAVLSPVQKLLNDRHQQPKLNSSMRSFSLLARSSLQATKMANDPELSHMKLIPWSGVAAPLSSLPSAQPLSGSAYCFLPLPVKTNLPVHVNGYFELSSNRRDVWWGDDMAGDGRARAEWNFSLVHDIAAPSYSRLVKQCASTFSSLLPSSSSTSSSSSSRSSASSASIFSYVEKLLPVDGPSGNSSSVSPLWEILLCAFYTKTMKEKILYSLNSNAWVAPSDCVLLSDPEDDNLRAILQAETALPLVTFSNDDLRQTLLKRDIATKKTTPMFIREYYSMRGPNANAYPSLVQNHGNAKFLLLYAVKDLPSSSNYADLNNIPFIPLADGKSLGAFAVLPSVDDAHLSQLRSMGFSKFLALHALRRFSNNLEDAIEWLFEHRHEAPSVVTHGIDPYFICGGAAAEILSPSPNMYINEANLEDFPVLLKLFKNKKLQRRMNVISHEPEMLADAVARAIPMHWRDREAAPWLDSGEDDDGPGGAWFKSLWTYICSHEECLPHVAEQYCIMPTNEGIVTNLSRGASVVLGDALSPAVTDALKSLDVRTVFKGLLAFTNLKVPKRIYDYVFEPTPEAIVRAIDASRRRTKNERFFSRTDENCLSALYDFLVSRASPDSYSQDTQDTLAVLKSFPIFKVYDDDNKSCVYMPLDASDVEFVILSTVPTPVDELVFAALTSRGAKSASSNKRLRFLKLSHISDTKIMARLSVKVCGIHEYYNTLVFPNLESLGVDVVQEVVTQLLTSLPTLVSKEPDFKHVVAGTQCVPNNNGFLHKPSDLFDPENYQLTVLLDDDAFPSQHFRNAELLLSLRSLGLLTTLTLDSALKCAKRIEKSQMVLSSAAESTEENSENFAATIVSRARELLSFFDSNAQIFFPKPKKKRSLIRKISDRLSLLGNSEEVEEIRRKVDSLLQTMWVPVLLTPPNAFLPWDDSWSEMKCVVAKPVNCFCADRMWLASSGYRLVDGEVHTPELKSILGWNKDLSMLDVSYQLRAISSNFSKLKEEIGNGGGDGDGDGFNDLNQLCQAISSEVPRIYQILNGSTSDHDIGCVRTALYQVAWLWMGDSFVLPAHAAFSSPINASPYLHTVPPDLACFSNLLKIFGVRQRFGTTDFCGVLKRIYEQQQSRGAPLLPAAQLTDLSVAICQLLSDDVMRLNDIEIFAPDSSGTLHPSADLVYDDAPWLSKSSTNVAPHSDKIFVHPKISPTVGDKLFIKSLRAQLLTTTSEALDFGSGSSINAEAFGQAESLTRRLKNIIEMYPEGPSILSELIQNADDSKASTVKILVSKKQYGDSSLLGPKMGKWQGPSIYVYNDSTFTERDFVNLSRIGQASKLDKLITTGRFGLGFNSVFHWTDLPSFVTGDHLVVFDPHEKYVPGATSTSRGLKIKFKDSDLLSQFPDQFSPYCKFGCDMKSRFNGTLFRFPLRDQEAANDSEISKTVFGESELDELLRTFKKAIPKFLLFLRNIGSIEVYLESDGEQDQPILLYSAAVGKRQQLQQGHLKSWSAVSDFVTGPSTNPLSKESFYSKLTNTPEQNLPNSQHLVTIILSSDGKKSMDQYLVCVALGGRRCKEFACSEKHRHMKFLPWAGVAAHVKSKIRGNAFCFLPLPVETGMPVHVNGYFELSANRRDIWIGSDMTGEGRIRSEWNEILLEDVVAPLYASMLSCARNIMGDGDSYYNLWPVKSTSMGDNNELMFSSAIFEYVTSSLYKNNMKNNKLFWCKGAKSWVALDECVVVEESGSAEKLIDILSKGGLQVAVLPKKVVDMLLLNSCTFNHVSPSFVREHCKANDPTAAGTGITRVELLQLLLYCVEDLKSNGEDYKALVNLPLLPLSDGSMGRFLGAGEKSCKFKVAQLEKNLLSRVKSEVVDTETPSAEVNRLLLGKEVASCTNVKNLSVDDLFSLLGQIYPTSWDCLDEVLWNPDEDSSQVEKSWVRHFWSYCLGAREEGEEEVDLNDKFEKSAFQLLPSLSSDDQGVLLKLRPRLPVVSPMDPSVPQYSPINAPLDAVLKSLRIKLLDVDCFELSKRPPIVSLLIGSSYAQLPTASGVLKAVSYLFPDGIEDGDLMGRISRLFRGVPPNDRETLRCFFRETTEREENVLKDPSLVRILKALPIYRVFQRNSGARAAEPPSIPSYLDLLSTKRWIPPVGVNVSLLDSNFVDATDRRDVALLNKIGVTTMNGKRFYLKVAMPRISDRAGLTGEVRDDASLKLLKDLPRLMMEADDSGEDDFLDVMKRSKFVPNKLGNPVAPGDLYDPDIFTLTQLLGRESFPDDMFCARDILASLRSLGMRDALSCEGVLDSANSIASKLEGTDVSLSRSKCLLRFLDENIESLLEECKAAGGNASKGEEKWNDAESFIDKITSLPWLPCKTIFSDEMLPRHPNEGIAFASADCTRPQDDAWLCSASKRLLDGIVRSETLKDCFGWNEDVEVYSVAVQLLALSDIYPKKGGLDSTFRQTLASIIPRIYTLLDSFLRVAQAELSEKGGEASASECGSKLDEMVRVKDLFHSQRWLFVGDVFVGTGRVAFEAPSNARPHLFSVPPELQCFNPMLKFLGVRERFSCEDYISVNQSLRKRQGENPLSELDLELAVGMAKLLAAEGKEVIDAASSSAGSIFVPSDSNILQVVEDTVYDDAPWLSSSLAGKLRLRFVHSKIPCDAAMMLGARSLREVLLANQSGMQNIPCPSADSLRQLHSKRAWCWSGKSDKKIERGAREDSRAIMDLLEVAEMAGVNKVKVLADYRTHNDESLLHPGLKAAQGCSILVCFDGAVIGVDELVRLSAPSGFYRSCGGRFESGSPRFGAALCSLYQLGDCVQVLSGNQLHLFDPTGQYLFSGGSGDAAVTDSGNKSGNGSSRTSSKKRRSKSRASKLAKSKPIARRYGINSSDVFDNFSDQYAPFMEAPFGVKEAFLEGGPGFFKGTIFRISMRTKEDSMKTSLSRRSYTCEDVAQIVSRLSSSIGENFIFTTSLRALEIYEWREDEQSVRNKVKAYLRTSNLERKSHAQKLASNQDWKKNTIATFFKKWDAVKSKISLEVDIASFEGEDRDAGARQLRDTYMCVSVLAPKGLRDLATGNEFKRLNCLPVLRVSAHMHRAELAPGEPGAKASQFKPRPGRLFVGGLDTGLETGLPVNICAPIFLHELSRGVLLNPRDDADLRTIFPKIRVIEDASARSGGSVSAFKHLCLWEWNRSALQCAVRKLVPYLLKELREPIRQLHHDKGARYIYHFWPRHEIVKEKYRAFVSRELYVKLSDMDLYLTKRNGFRTIRDGVFESKEMALTARAGTFFRGEFAMFNVPAVVGNDIQSRGGVKLSTLTPSMARNFLRASYSHGKQALEASLRGNVKLVVELFLFCLCDCPAESEEEHEALRGLVGLPLFPMIDGELAVTGGSGFGGFAIMGKKPAIVADRQQQLLLPNLQSCFLDSKFVSGVGDKWFRSKAFMKVMNVKHFDAGVLSSNMSKVLPKSWERKDFVSWNYECERQGVQVDSTLGPSPLWIKLFWSQVKIFDQEKVSMFSNWPLIPTGYGELASCSNARFVVCLSRKLGDVRLGRVLAIEHQQLLKTIRKEEEQEEDDNDDNECGDNEEKKMISNAADIRESCVNDWTGFFSDFKVYDEDEVLSDEDEDEDEDEDKDEDEDEGGEQEQEQEQDEEVTNEGGGAKGRTGRDSRQSEAEEDDTFVLADESLDELPPIEIIEALPAPPVRHDPVLTPPSPPTDADEAQDDGALPAVNSLEVLDLLEASPGIQFLSTQLKKIRAPSLEPAFFSREDFEKVLLVTPDRTSLCKKVLLLLSHSSTYWPVHSEGGDERLLWSKLTLQEREKLLQVLVYDDQNSRLDLLSSDLDKLRKLPLFETLGGTYVALGGGGGGGGGGNAAVSDDNYTLDDGLTWDEVNDYLPDSAKYKFLKQKGIGELLKDLHVEALTEPKLLLKFVLPAFPDMPDTQKDNFLRRVQIRWDSLKESQLFKDKMKETKFVLRGSGSSSPSRVYVKPARLFDPRHHLLSAMYKEDKAKFPHEDSYANDDQWLDILKELGLVATIDKDVFLQCAKTVEAEQSYKKSLILHSFLADNFADFFDPVFARKLSTITFVPALLNTSNQKELVTFEAICTPKDANLAFTMMPLLVDEACPPQVMWSSLGIVSPPPMDVVLAHLRNLTDGGGFLGRWNFNAAGPTAVFSSMFKFLEDNWDKLSPSVRASLKDVTLVPIDGELVKPKVIFFRLNMNLQPLLYELPRWCGGASNLFEKIGVRESPEVEDYKSCLIGMHKDVGTGVLNPNELQAVLKLCALLADASAGGTGSVDGVFSVDDSSRMCSSKSLLYNDAPWLNGRLNRKLIKLTHPKMKSEVSDALKIPRLSESVVELLEDNFVPCRANGGGNEEGEVFTSRLKSPEFKRTVVALGGKDGNFGKLDSMTVELVDDLKTRLVLKKAGGRGGVNVTASASGTASFYDAKTNRIFVATARLPKSLRAELVVATNLCDVVGIARTHVGTISAILGTETEDISRVTKVMKVGGGHCDDGNYSTELERGGAGVAVTGEDEARLKLVPLKNFSVGEIIAYRDTTAASGGGYRYGSVLGVGEAEEGAESGDGSRQGGGHGSVRILRVDKGYGVKEDVMSSEVYSFDKARARARGSAESGKAGEETEEKEEEEEGGVAGVAIHPNLLEAAAPGPTEGGGGGESSATASSRHNSNHGAIGRVSHRDAVRAASDILRSANINLSSNVEEMMAEAIELKRARTAADGKVQQIRSELLELVRDLTKEEEEGTICPITRIPFEDPVIASDGFTYEREAIEQWLRSNNRSPQTNQVLTSRILIPNRTLRSQLETTTATCARIEEFAMVVATDEDAS